MTKLGSCATAVHGRKTSFRTPSSLDMGVLALCSFMFLTPLSNAIFTASADHGGLGTLTFTIPQPRLSLTRSGAYARLDFETEAGLPSHLDTAGAPKLPRLSLFISIPWNAVIVSCQIAAGKRTELPGKYLIEHCEQPCSLSPENSSGGTSEPNATVYSLGREYPGRLLEDAGTARMSGMKAAHLYVYPVQYVPACGKLVQYTDLKVKIKYAISNARNPDEEILTPSTHLRSTSPLVRTYEELLLKPDRAVGSEGGIFANALRLSPAQSDAQSWQADCALIGPAGMMDELLRFEAFYDSVGTPTFTKTVESIDTNYQGRDLAERIRNFVRDAYMHDVHFVVLAGDRDQVPPRFVKDPFPAGQDPGNVPCDYYYACLDGNWDADGDGVYGESEDQTDWFPEVLVTRLPAKNPTELRNMVDKTIEFSRTLPSDWQNNILLAGADVGFEDDSKAFLQTIRDELIVPYTSATLTELYEHESLTTQSLLDTIGSGAIAVTFRDHGKPYEWRMAGSTLLAKGDVERLENLGRYPMILADACSTAYFDWGEDCIGETFLTAEGRGAVFYIGSSRTAVNTESGEKGITEGFWEEVCKERVVSPLEALTNAKIKLASRYDPTSNVISRKTIYAFMSFGALVELPIFDADDHEPPRLVDMGQRPQYPAETDEVLVSTSVMDRGGIGSVNLSYRVGNGPWVSNPMSRSVALVAISSQAAFSSDDVQYLGVTHDLYTEANISLLFPRLADYRAIIIGDHAASSPSHVPESAVIRAGLASNQIALLGYVEGGGGLWVSAQNDYSWLPGPLYIANLGQRAGRRVDQYFVSSPMAAQPNSLACYASSSTTPSGEDLYVKYFADWDNDPIGTVHGIYESVATDASTGTAVTTWIAGSCGEGRVVLTTLRLELYSGHSSTETSIYFRTRMAVENILAWISGGSAKPRTYTGMIPPAGTGTVVSYFVKAADSAGLTATSPIQSYTVGLPTTATLVGIGQASLPADCNADGTINVFDLVFVARAMGSVEGSEGYVPYADVNGDGVVNLYDLVLVAKDFGEDSTLAQGQEFCVDLSVQNVTDLQRYRFNLTYDPGMLDIVSVAEGAFLGGDGIPTYWTAPAINRTLGTIVGAGATRALGQGGIEGSGPIATLRFVARKRGTTELALEVALFDPEGQAINSRPLSTEICIGD